ncbi:MAG: DNA repair protein RadC [Akkermansia sp.]
MPDSLPPTNLLPREKLLTLGKESLSNAELIAIFLRTGLRGKNVFQLSLELIENAGSLEALARLNTKEISELAKGIGLAKAATLVAAFELGCRALREESERHPFSGGDDVYDYMITNTRWLDQETLYVLLLDAQSRLITKIAISVGTLNESIAHPRDIIKPAITNNAYAFVLVHNHPSGDPAPSRPDDDITHRIYEAADILMLNFYDHIIMGKPDAHANRNYYSYRDNGRLK